MEKKHRFRTLRDEDMHEQNKNLRYSLNSVVQKENLRVRSLEKWEKFKMQ